MIYTISNIILILAVFGFFWILNNPWTFRSDALEALTAFLCVILMIVIGVMNFIITPLKHTVSETHTLIQHSELSLNYAECEKQQNINCAAIIEKVIDFNSDLRSYKHYNEIFDLYYSDEVAALPLIGER